MIDLVCLVPDKNIEATIDGLLARHQALGIRQIEFEIRVHPGHDPGCFQQPERILSLYTDNASHALVVLDQQWEGSPADTAAELERFLDEALAKLGPAGWAKAVVIGPEIEAWVFSSSPHVPTTLGWTEPKETFRAALETEGLWTSGKPKPDDPKRAVQWVLHRSRIPRSSSLYRKLASSVSLRGCEDRSFQRMIEILRGWFGSDRVRG